MREKIFETMENYGWNLEDFNKVFETHYNFIESLYDYFREHDEGMKSCDLNDIDEQKLHDMADFMSDFLRAFKDSEWYVKTLEEGLMNALDKLSELDKDFDYYDTLRELTHFGNYEALDFLDRLGSDNNEEFGEE